MQEFITLANRLADEAGKIVKQYYRQPFDVTTKADKSPVTIADQTIEQTLRDILAKERPDDGIFGEEFDDKPSKNGLTWVIDPIDGTKPFVTGRPTFGTLIALCEEGVPVLGVIDQAIVKDRWVGAKGHGATLNGMPCKTRKCEDFENAISASTAPGMFQTLKEDFVHEWRASGQFIIWGGDCISYGQLASGWLDLIFEGEMKPHDYLALVPIIEEAGGKITDWNGAPLTINSGHTVLAAGDERIWSKGYDLIQNNKKDQL